ncbi:hypothetical protein COV40_00650 [Candidatus Berkelbacteria bacterium CG11_big_fil_rev_8_21_14_0_20_42_15]|uniref:DUF4012 domain-containing protein n=4 Tax=Candidatus Berkelbacteria TaxID=1618330 RepID=A0A2H0Q0M5_9BACT|nr:MAG: hypothetical protein COV40_00650 [Candidatus Berkelbacteria bacterium CG11_big_fil_rev_8_21_14_0_20_42_15]
MSRAKAKITSTTAGLNKDFSAFLDAIGSKDIFSLSKYIDSFNQKSQDSLLILQSSGQDIYIFSLLYPKGKSSQMTSMTDTIRAGHLLTSSYAKFIDTESIAAIARGDDWTVKVNKFLDQIKEYNSFLPANIFYARIYSQQASLILANTSSSSFSGDEKKTAENLKKLSAVSMTFFDYLSDLPNDLGQNLTLSGGKKSYLILFLNNAEIRPGGGFVGSFARADLENGQITKIDFEKNIYTLDKAFLAAGNKVTPPKELQALGDSWTMRDSNMSADFAESAKRVAWFYQQESGDNVDGVIAIDTTLFINLLKIVGPIDMPEYNLMISDKNFLSDVQYQVEIGYYQNQENWSENQPKKILADMMPKFITLITAGGVKQKEINSELFEAICEKHFLFYLKNSKLEDLIDGIGASGKIRNSSGDYLYPVDANIGGYKSSLEIEENVRQDVLIKNSGDVEEKISILRKHNGSYDWPGGINNNYLKIYLPMAVKVKSVEFSGGDNNPRSDSNLAEEEKYSSDLEFGKTVVGFWQNTKPGEQSQSTITFVRENAIQTGNDQFDYQITIQKQPGVEKFNWALYLVYPEGWKPQNVENYDAKNHQIFLKEEIRRDQVFRLRFIRSGSE